MPTTNSVPMYKRVTLAILLATLTTASHALTYDAALRIAESRAAQLQARANTVAAAQAARISAGELPDPKLVAGIDNLPVTGEDAFSVGQDFMTMRKIGVIQGFTNADKREAARQQAGVKVELANADLQIERLVVRREAALAWLKVYFVQQQQTLLDQLDAENSLLASSVKARLAAGQINASDALLPQQEAIALADRRDNLSRDLGKARAEFARWVGDAASEALSGEPPAPLLLSEPQLGHALERHPDLTVFNSLEDAARADVAMAQAAKKSDWEAELAYQQRGPAFSNMISVQFTFDLPIFSKTRQDPLIVARQQEMERVMAEREAKLREHTEELHSMLAERTALTRQIERLDSAWLPLAQQKIELTTASYRAGQGALSTVLEARKFLIDTRMKRIELDAQRAAVEVRLRYLTTENQS